MDTPIDELNSRLTLLEDQFESVVQMLDTKLAEHAKELKSLRGMVFLSMKKKKAG